MVYPVNTEWTEYPDCFGGSFNWRLFVKESLTIKVRVGENKTVIYRSKQKNQNIQFSQMTKDTL